MSSPPDEPGMRRTLLGPVLIAVAVQLLLTAASAAGKLRLGSEDTDIYARYAALIRAGKVPYRDFRVEYPPLALPLFVLPYLLAPGGDGYRVAVAVEMLIFNAATVWLVAAWVERQQGRDRVRNRLAWYTLFYLLLSRLIVSRYDAAAMFVGFAASCCWFSGRTGLGGATAAFGTLLKVYPAVVAVVATPFDLSRTGRQRGRGALAFATVMLLGSLAWLALGGARGVTESLGYQLGRGFEFGSLYSGVQMLAAKVAGVEIQVVRDHAAWSSITPWTDRWLPLVLPIQAATILLVVGVFVRRGMRDGVRYSGAAILAFIITGKVFSPQYLLWLLPYVAVVEGPIARRACWLFASGCGATLVGPALIGSFPRTSAAVILTYNAKNALFLGLLVILTFGPEATSARNPSPR